MGLFQKEFEIKNGTLVHYNGKGGQVLVPSGVTRIGAKAFAGRTDITSVCLPEGLCSIGESAFSECTSLMLVDIPATVTEIEKAAFYWCTDLDGIILPEGLTRISENCFHYCRSLQQIYIPRAVVSIEHGAFGWCDTLVRVTLPDGLQHIGASAFECCKSLLRIDIPHGVTSMEANVFRCCSNLEFTIHEGLKYLGDLYNPYHLLVSVEQHDISACKLHPDTKIIASEAFWGCEELKLVELPNGLYAIGDRAFGCCPKLWRLDIPSSVCDIAPDLGVSESFAIAAYVGSYAETYAKWRGITYYPLYYVPNT